MRDERSLSRLLILALNALGILLAVFACADFVFIGHNYDRSEIYLVCAIATLAAAAVVSRVPCLVNNKKSMEGALTKPPGAPFVSYLFIAVCVALLIAGSFTDLFDQSRLISILIGVFAIAAFIMVVVERRRSLQKAGVEFKRTQKFGLSFGIIMAIMYLVWLIFPLS